MFIIIIIILADGTDAADLKVARLSKRDVVNNLIKDKIRY